MFIHKQFVGSCVAVALAFSFLGCGSSGDNSGASLDSLAGAADAQKAAEKKRAEAAAKAAEDQKAAAAQAAQTPPEPEKKAVGSRPQFEGGGIYGAAMSARRHAMNFADSIAWIQGVRSFKAEEGRKPKNTQEFMKVVVPKYELQLPKLEEGQEYEYDPNGETDGDFGQLYIVTKEAPAAAAPSAPAATPPEQK